MFKFIDKATELRPGDIVVVHNGYETRQIVLTEHDIELGSVSNGLHNERASLYRASYGFHPMYCRPQTDLFAGE